MSYKIIIGVLFLLCYAQYSGAEDCIAQSSSAQNCNRATIYETQSHSKPKSKNINALMRDLNSKQYSAQYATPYLHKIAELSEYFLGTEFGFIRRQVNASNFEKKVAILVKNDDFYYDLNYLDCVTYIEIVLALALSSQNDKEFNKDNFEKHLKAIRYKNSEAAFFARNHIAELDWLRNNNWLVQDITKSLFKKYGIKKSGAFIDRLNWLYVTQNLDRCIHKESNKYYTEQDLAYALQLHNVYLAQENSTLTYIPLLKFLEHYDDIKKKLPEVCIINIVRSNLDDYKDAGTALNITHQGFLIKKDGKLFIRHATAVFPSQVVNVELDKYLEQFAKSGYIKGINIWQLKEPLQRSVNSVNKKSL